MLSLIVDCLLIIFGFSQKFCFALLFPPVDSVTVIFIFIYPFAHKLCLFQIGSCIEARQDARNLLTTAAVSYGIDYLKQLLDPSGYGRHKNDSVKHDDSSQESIERRARCHMMTRAMTSF